nr:(2Fe-2S) ferredoxin domain-containing protein [Nocardioides perillae]
MAATVPGAEVAFLQLGDPSLSGALTRLADTGAARVDVVGVSLGPLAPGATWVRRVAGHWWRERTGDRPVVAVAPRLLGELDAAALHDVRRDARPLTGAEPGLTSAAWEGVTHHRRQLLVCRGPRCTARGSDATAEAVVLALVEAGCTDDDVLVTHTGCLLPCNHAPVVVVHPDDAWCGGVTPEVGRRLVAAVLDEGGDLAAAGLPLLPR